MNSFKVILFGNPRNMGDPCNYFQGGKEDYSQLVVGASILGKCDFSYETLDSIFVIGSKVEDFDENTKKKVHDLNSFKSAYSSRNRT